MGVKADPLKFAYVRITMVGEEVERPHVYKIFHVDDVKIRLRKITIVHGNEVEGDNIWLPWASIECLREVDSK